jgi:hypothetical protein
MANKIQAKHRLLLSRKIERDKLTKRRRIRDLNSQAHEIANQLSVINLCCFELRDSLAGELNGDQLRRLDTIAIAVAEAADLLDKVSENLEAMTNRRGRGRPSRPFWDFLRGSSHEMLSFILSRGYSKEPL